jgi:hypothetical protein
MTPPHMATAVEIEVAIINLGMPFWVGYAHSSSDNKVVR